MCQQSSGYQADFGSPSQIIDWKQLEDGIFRELGIRVHPAEVFAVSDDGAITPFVAQDASNLLVVPLKASVADLLNDHLTKIIDQSRAFLLSQQDSAILGEKVCNILTLLRNAGLGAEVVDQILDPINRILAPISRVTTDHEPITNEEGVSREDQLQFMLEKMVLASMSKEQPQGLFQRSRKLVTFAPEGSNSGYLGGAPWNLRQELPYAALAKAGLLEGKETAAAVVVEAESSAIFIRSSKGGGISEDWIECGRS